jgi:hypothetical protein
MAEYLHLYTTIDDCCLQNGEVMSLLYNSGFKQTTKSRNVFYRTVLADKINQAVIGVSYYYYIKRGLTNTKKVSRNRAFDILVTNIKNKHERDLHDEEFNRCNGYV